MENTSLGTRLGMFEIVGDIPIDPVRIDGDEAILGRDPGSDIVLEDPRVSRRHARVWMDEHRMMIQDLGSKSGTVVNGTVIAGPCELRTGDHLRMGLTELAVVWNPGLASTLEMPTLDAGLTTPHDLPIVTIDQAAPGVDDADDAYRTLTVPGIPSRGRDERSRSDDESRKRLRRGKGAVVPPPQRPAGSSSDGHDRSGVVDEVSDVALDATTDRMPMWLYSIVMMFRRPGR